MKNAYVYDGIRTPFGRYGGELQGIRPDDLMAMTIAELLKKYPQIRDKVEDVVIGDSNQAGEDARNIARNSALLSGLHLESGGITVNRLCGSGLAAAHLASNAIACNEGSLYVAGGVESMTRAPLVIAKQPTAFSRSLSYADSTIGWRFPNNQLLEKFGNEGMPNTSDNIGSDLQISREDSDVFAFESQMKYEKARKDGFYENELFSVTIPPKSRKEKPYEMNADEHPRPTSTLEKLATLRPLNAAGVTTAGNASGVNDGAAALLIGDEKVQKLLGVSPTARILGTAVAGVAPRVMGLGPVKASQKILARTGLSLKDMDLIEVNEAFATQVLGCLKSLKLPFNDSRVNPNGGAIAIGHPLGASGARLLLTASRELKRRNGKYALVSLCIGIGQGIAMIIENTDKK